MSNLSIRTRLLLMLALFCTVAVAVSAVSIFSLSTTREAMVEALEQQSAMRYRAVRAAMSFMTMDDEEGGLLYATQADEKGRRVAEEDQRYAQVQEDLTALYQLAGSDTKALVDQFRALLAEYRRGDAEIRKLVLGGEQDQANELLLGSEQRLLERLLGALDSAGSAAPSSPRAVQLLKEVAISALRLDALVTRMQMQRRTERREESARAVEQQQQRLQEQLATLQELGPEGQRAFARVGSTAEDFRRAAGEVARLGLVNAVYRSREIGLQTEATARSASQVAEQIVERTGEDLRQKQAEVDAVSARARLAVLALSALGIAGAVAFALVTIRRVQEGVDAIRRVAAEVADSSAQLRSATQAIARRASEEASSLEETSSTMEQLTGLVEQNRGGAARARELSERARDSARQGAEVATQAAEAMRALRDAGAKVSEISETVSEIAFQTNILALNASVEAARAGDHGRGFTVVATEVRTLAQRSGVAAREISALIRDSLQRIERGAELVGQSSGDMGRIADGSKEASALVANISTAAQEQAAGITQVTQSLLQLNQVVQANSAQAEELAASAEGLAVQSRELIRAVEIISGGGGLVLEASGAGGPSGPGGASSDAAQALSAGVSRLPGVPPPTAGAPAPIHADAHPRDFTGF